MYASPECFEKLADRYQMLLDSKVAYGGIEADEYYSMINVYESYQQLHERAFTPVSGQT